MLMLVCVCVYEASAVMLFRLSCVLVFPPAAENSSCAVEEGLEPPRSS